MAQRQAGKVGLEQGRGQRGLRGQGPCRNDIPGKPRRAAAGRTVYGEAGRLCRRIGVPHVDRHEGASAGWTAGTENCWALVAGALLFRANPLFGAVIGLLLGHALDRDLFRTFRTRDRDDPYAELGLTESASEAEIDQAYRRLMSQYHPDKVAGAAPELRARAEQRSRAINAAYDRIRARRRR